MRAPSPPLGEKAGRGIVANLWTSCRQQTAPSPRPLLRWGRGRRKSRVLHGSGIKGANLSAWRYDNFRRRPRSIFGHWHSLCPVHQIVSFLESARNDRSKAGADIIYNPGSSDGLFGLLVASKNRYSIRTRCRFTNRYDCCRICAFHCRNGDLGGLLLHPPFSYPTTSSHGRRSDFIGWTGTAIGWIDLYWCAAGICGVLFFTAFSEIYFLPSFGMAW